MFTRTWCVAALLIVSVPAASQTVLSEAEALARLAADSPRARAIRAGVDVARAEVLAAARYPNPRLAVDREAVAGVAETLTTVLQPLPITGRRTLEREAALAVADADVAARGRRRSAASRRPACWPTPSWWRRRSASAS